MKTPEEIKKGLECCSKTDKCPECPYVGEVYCATKKNVDALALIQRLEANASQVKKALQDNGFQTLRNSCKRIVK